VVLLDCSNEEDEAAMADQPSGGYAATSSSLDLEEDERRALLEAERRSKFNAEQSCLQPGKAAAHGKGPAGETSAPPPQVSAIPNKRGWVECDAS
jgi:hypothetical protein